MMKFSKAWQNTLKFEQMAEGSSPDDDKAIPWIALSKSSDQKLCLEDNPVDFKGLHGFRWLENMHFIKTLFYWR